MFDEKDLSNPLANLNDQIIEMRKGTDCQNVSYIKWKLRVQLQPIKREK